jgi:hypothetical protein
MIEMAKGGCTVILAARMPPTTPRHIWSGRFILLGEGEETLVELGSSGRRERHSCWRRYRIENGTASKSARPTCLTKPPRSRLGPGGHRKISPHLVQAAWLFFDEHGHDAWLPVPLQLVRQTDLGTKISFAFA